MDANRISLLLKETEDCVKLATLGDAGPVKNLIAELAFELGKAHGQIKSEGYEADALRWRWWRQFAEVKRDSPGDWTCWIEIPCIAYRSQTTSPDELTDALIKRFPLAANSGVGTGRIPRATGAVRSETRDLFQGGETPEGGPQATS